MNELQKCLSGKIFNCTDSELINIISNARTLTAMYNKANFNDTYVKNTILTYLFHKIGSKCKNRPTVLL